MQCLLALRNNPDFKPNSTHDKRVKVVHALAKVFPDLDDLVMTPHLLPKLTDYLNSRGLSPSTCSMWYRTVAKVQTLRGADQELTKATLTKVGKAKSVLGFGDIRLNLKQLCHDYLKRVSPQYLPLLVSNLILNDRFVPGTTEITDTYILNPPAECQYCLDLSTGVWSRPNRPFVTLSPSTLEFIRQYCPTSEQAAGCPVPLAYSKDRLKPICSATLTDHVKTAFGMSLEGLRRSLIVLAALRGEDSRELMDKHGAGKAVVRAHLARQEVQDAYRQLPLGKFPIQVNEPGHDILAEVNSACKRQPLDCLDIDYLYWNAEQVCFELMFSLQSRSKVNILVGQLVDLLLVYGAPCNTKKRYHEAMALIPGLCQEKSQHKVNAGSDHVPKLIPN